MDCSLDTYSEFQANIFSNNRDITKCQFLHDDSNDDAKAIAIPQFSLKTAKRKMLETHIFPYVLAVFKGLLF